MSIATRPLSAEEFFAMPGSRHQELVRGEVVETMPPGGVHGIIAALIVAALLQWSRHGSGGSVGVESGFIIARDPDVVRSPDAYYVRPERVPASGVPTGFWPLAPDLAVEVVSPSDTAEEVREKVRESLAAGSAAVWVVYPTTRELIAHTPDGLARTYAPGTSLESPDLLPGFAMPISELFL